MDVYVFDIDGTLSNHSRRIPLAPKDKYGSWTAFQKDCENDPPIPSGLSLALALQRSDTLIFMTSRDKNTYKQTRDWLVAQHLDPEFLFMREVGDYTSAEELKLGWLENNLPDYMWVVSVFEDNDATIKFLRKHDYHCCQVANGGF